MTDLSISKHRKGWPSPKLRRRLGLWPILPKSFHRLQVSLPNAPIHVSHVTHDKATGEFHGLPAEWQRLVAEDEEQGESRPTAIIEVPAENTAHPAQAVRVPPSSTIARQSISLTRSASIVAPLDERMPDLVRNVITSRWMKVLISRSKEKKHSASPNFANKEHSGDPGSTGNGPISKTNKTSTFNNQLPNQRSRLRSTHTNERQRHSRVAQSKIQHYKEGQGNGASDDQWPFYLTEPRALEPFSPRERTLTQASLSDNSDSQTSFILPIQHPEPMALSKHSKGARVNEFESIADLCKFEDPEQVFYDLTEIAQGAFGRIYAGSKRGFDGILAIKQVRLKNEVTARLTAKEIKASSDVSHLNIIQFVETYVWADQVWMIMEFVDGGTLTDVISSNSLKEGEIATICSQILQAVQCLHTSGFIHRDIKSDNVLLSRNGVVKLCDLGLCERISNNHDKLSEMAGTPHWMAPEIFESQGYGREVDIWSFGITVVEMIDGEPPHLATPWWQLGFLVKNYATPRPRNWESTSPALQDFLTCALAVKPAERPSPNELLQHKFLQLSVEPAELGRLFQTT